MGVKTNQHEIYGQNNNDCHDAVRMGRTHRIPHVGKMMNPMLAVLTIMMLGVSWRCGKRYDVVKYESEIDPMTLAYNRRSADVIFQRLAGKHRKMDKNRRLFLRRGSVQRN